MAVRGCLLHLKYLSLSISPAGDRGRRRGKRHCSNGESEVVRLRAPRLLAGFTNGRRVRYIASNRIQSSSPFATHGFQSTHCRIRDLIEVNGCSSLGLSQGRSYDGGDGLESNSGSGGCISRHSPEVSYHRQIWRQTSLKESKVLIVTNRNPI